MSYGVGATKPLSFWLKEIWDHGRKGHALARTAAGLGALSPLMALANPTGGQVVAGSAHISTPSANSTLIRETSQNAVINWQQFSVGSNQFVQFLQPDSSAIVLNRVIGGNASAILGDITANGQVFLINPNGILFGRGATLDVSGLVASTQAISNADFMAGRYDFLKGSGAPSASIINQGTITSSRNGYVVLAGDYVENDGVIQAQSGRVLLAAGGATTLTLDRAEGLISYSIDGATLARLAGVSNTGEISADGGTVIMTADVANALTATAVNNSGFVAARSIKSRDGVIILAAQGGGIDNSGTLDASASQAGVGGGAIIIRGDGVTKLDPTSQIDAAGDGAMGGFVELSGHNLSVRGHTDLGHGGNLLLDPANLKIVTGSGVAFSPSDNVGSGYIKHQLSLGNNVYLVASKSIGKASNVTNITESSTGQAGKLSLRMGTLTVGAGGSLAGTHCVNAGVCGLGTNVKFTKATGGKINLPGLTIKINGAFEASASHGTVSIGAVTAKTVVVDAVGGTVKLGAVTANSAFPISAATVGGLGAYVNAPSGHVTVAGKIMASHGGVVINGGNVAFGSVSAGGKLSVSAHKPGAATASISVVPGKLLKARSVRLFASGSDGATIITSAIDAKGGSISIDARANASHATKVSAGSLSAATRVSVQESGGGNGGFITVGNITAGGSVFVRASDANGTGGSVGVGAITGRTIQITARAKKGADINVAGTLTATASRGQVNISASEASAAANGGNVNVTGNIDALQGHVRIFTHGGGVLGGNLHVGSIDARGAVSISANYLGAGSSFVAHTGNITATNGFVAVSMNGHDPQFSAGAITAKGASFAKPSFFEAGAIHDGFVSIGLNAGSTAVASGGAIKVNGFVLSSHSDVSFFVKNGNIKFTGASNVIHAIDKVVLTANSISAAGALSINAHDAGIATASIAVNAASLKAASVKLLASGSHAGKITTGNITATGAVIGTGITSTGGSIVVKTTQLLPTVFTRRGIVTTGDLSATGRITVFGTNISVGGVNAGRIMFLSASGTSARHATVTASKAIVFGAYGSIDANGPSGSIHVGNVTATNGSVSFFASGNGAHPGGKITVGNVTSKHYVAFFADSRAGSVNVGTIKASTSYVSISAAKLATTGPITAASYVSFYGGKFTVGGAITAGAYVEMRGTQINVAGPITAGSQFGVTLPGHSRPVNSGFIELFANSATGKASVNISGSVSGRTDSITANGGAGAGVKTGNVTATAGKINISAITLSGTHAGNISAGNLDAAGYITLSQEGHSGGIRFGSISAHGANPSPGHAGVKISTVIPGFSGVGGNVSGGSITAAGGGVQVLTSDANGSGANVHLGKITAPYISVHAVAKGGASISVGSLDATGTGTASVSKDISLFAHATGPGFSPSFHGSARGNITVNGNITGAGRLGVDAFGGSDSGAIIKVNGNINVANSVHILAVNDGTRGAFVNLRSVTGKFIDIEARATNAAAVGSDARITISGNVKATGTASSISPSNGVRIAAGSSGAPNGDPQITVTGNITASHGAVNISVTGKNAGRFITLGSGSGSAWVNGQVKAQTAHIDVLGAGAGGKIDTGAITLLGSGFRGDGSLRVTGTGGSGHIIVHGNIQMAGDSLTLFDRGGAGLGQSIKVTGSIDMTGAFGRADLSASSAAGAKVTAGNITAHGPVSLFARGGGASGGDIQVGNISAAGSVVMQGSHLGSAAGFLVQAGTIKGKDIVITVDGAGAVLKTAALTATGPSTKPCSDCGLSPGYVHINVLQPAPDSHGSINISGPVKSSHGNVSMLASNDAAINITGAVSAGKAVSLTASTINVGGAITAVSSAVLTGVQSSLNPTTITVTGLVKARNISVKEVFTSTAVKGGSIDLAGGASATGLGVGSISILASAAAPVKTKITTGALKTALRQISLFQKGGSGSVVVSGGAAAGGSGVDIATLDTGLGGNINVTGNISGRDVRISALGNGGGDINVTGSLHGTGCCSGIQLSAAAGATQAGGNVTVSGPITTTSGRIKIHTSGGGSAGGRINVGAMSARSSVSINANYHGTATGFTVKTGTIDALGVVKVSMNGKAPHFSAAGITAVGSCECGAKGVDVVLTPSIASGSSGVINIAGPVISSEAGLTLDAGHGSVIAGAITANALHSHRGSITIDGSRITVGAITDASSSVTLTGVAAAGASTDITVTGAINAKSLLVNMTLPSAATHGGSINLQQQVTTTGIGGIRIQALDGNPAAAVKLQINTAGLKASGGSVSIVQAAGQGGIHATGLISAGGGEVVIEAVGSGGMSLASLSAKTDAIFEASGSHGAIKITGNVTAGSSIELIARGKSGKDITVSGNVHARSSVSIHASASGNNSGGNISVGGNIVGGSGLVRITAHGGGASGGRINVGSISAQNTASITGVYTGASPGFSVKTGKITGEFVNVTATGKAPGVTIAGATATGASSNVSVHDYVHVTLLPTGATSGSINLTGPVKSMHGNVVLSAANGTITDSSGAAGKITAGGTIVITGGAMQLGSLSAAGLVRVSGSHGGVPAGNITVNGNIAGSSVNLTDFGVGGANVTVNGKVIAASHNLHITANAGSSHSGGNIVVTGRIAASSGFVSLDAHGGGANGGNMDLNNVVAGSGASINARYNGASTGFHVKAGLITGGFIQVNMDGKDPLFSAAGLAGQGHTCECSFDVAVRLDNASFAAALGGSIHLNGPVTATAGGVELNAGFGVINMGGNSISAAGASGRVRLEGGQLHLGSVKGTGNVSISAFGKSGNAASITNTSTDTITGTRVAINLDNSGSANGAKLAIGAVTATGAGTSVNSGQIKILDTGFSTQNVTVTTGKLSATKAVTVQITDASGSMSLGKLAAPSVKVSLAAGNVTVGAISAAAGGESISAAAGSLTVSAGGNESLTGGALKATGALHVHAVGNLTLSNVALTDSAFSASAGNNLTVAAAGSFNLVGQKMVAGGALTLTATGGVKIGHATIGGTAVNITATTITDSSAGGTITAGGGTLKAISGNIDLKGETLNLTAGTGPLLSAHGSVNLDSVTAGGAGNLGVHAGTAVNATNLTFTGGNLQITAGGALTLTSATVTAAGSVALHAASVGLGGAILKATHALDLQVTHGVGLAHATLSGSAVSVAAGGTITNSGSNVAIVAGTGGLSLKAGGGLILGGETLHVGGAALLSAGAALDLTGATLTAGGDMTLHGATLTETLANLTAGGGIAETGGSMDLTSASLTAGKGVSLTASKHILLGKTAITAGSAFSATANGSISNGGSAGAIIAHSAVLKAKGGNIDLSGETLHVGSGKATLSAAGGIALTGADIIAGNLSGVAAGSIDLSGVTARVGGTLQLVADKDIILSGVHITTGTFLAAASGTIHNGGGPGTITADAISLASKKDINLASTDITLGSGALPSFAGDALLLTELAGFGIGPTSATLNGAFLADGSLTLGGLTITGHYLALQGSSIAILGKVTAPTSGLLVQVMPFDPTAAIGVEDKAATTQTFNLSNQDFLALFPGDTIAIGDDVESGAVFIGANGPFTLANKTNLFFDTTGPVTGLDLITSTGLVTTLEVFVAATGGDVVTAGEIDPNAGSTTNTGLGDQTDKKHLGDPGYQSGGQQGGTISNDDSGTGVCH